MLKQRDTSFLPQTLTKQQRRIHRNREHRRSYSLRDVVMIGEFFGVALEMDLETGVARFHHDVVVRQVQLVQTFDVNRKWTASHSDHTSIQLVIARDGSQVIQSQI